MSVIRTDEWLIEMYDQPIELCEKLISQFDEDVSSAEIHYHLVMHGMYHQPVKEGTELIKTFRERNVWQIVQQEEAYLRKKWNGPNIPIYIFPAEVTNKKLRRDQNGKSGLAFAEKLFLFISEDNTEKEIQSLFTHEYNHACRLSSFNKNEADYDLLDTIILEGLAENAVRERFGSNYTAEWVSYYSDARLRRLFEKLILPNKNVSRTSRIHLQILYGLGFYPKMAGYCVGYYIVKRYMETNNVTSFDLLTMPSDQIIKKTDDM